MNYKIKKISETDEMLLFDFFKSAYPNRYNNLIKHWRWYYRLGYNNFEPIVIELNSKIIGMAGLIPSKLNYGNKVTEAIWFIDFFILKEFRNKGYGSIITKEWMKICPVQITFCNNESLKLFKKFSWEHNDNTYRKIKPTNLLGIIPFFKKFNSIFKIQNKSFKHIVPKVIENNDITKICKLEDERIFNKNLFSIVHDEDWFKWRLVNSPYKKNIYIFKNNFDVLIVNIFRYNGYNRLNILYSFISDPSNKDLYRSLINWSLDNKINYIWYLNNQENIFYKEEKILSKLFEKRMNFACWSEDKLILNNLKKGISNVHGFDSDTDSQLFVDK